MSRKRQIEFRNSLVIELCLEIVIECIVSRAEHRGDISEQKHSGKYYGVYNSVSIYGEFANAWISSIPYCHKHSSGFFTILANLDMNISKYSRIIATYCYSILSMFNMR